MEIFQQISCHCQNSTIYAIQNKVDIVAVTCHVQFFTKSGPIAGRENAAEKIKIY